MPPSRRRAWFTTLAAAALLASAPGAALAAPGDTFADLRDALASCTGTPTAPTTFELTTDISELQGELTVACAAIIDLAGHDLTVQNIAIEAGQQLTIEDTAAVDGTLTVDAPANRAGIRTTDATLVVLGGSLDITGGPYAAGIGGDYQRAGGTVRIEGGTITAGTNTWGGAAIGGGNNGNGGDITITGGTVTAVAEDRGAAIGGGALAGFGTITITGGTVTATGANRGAAIGGGVSGGGGTISISGGTVAASAGTGDNAIGGGQGAGVGVTISGGNVTANAPGGVGIAADPTAGTVITGGEVEVSGAMGIASGVPGSEPAPLSVAGTASVSITATYPLSAQNADAGHTTLEDSAQLTLNGGSVSLPASETPRLNVGGTAILAGDPTITGTGSIDNDGAILIDSDLVDVTVLNHHFQLVFDTDDGTPVPEPLTVFAASLAQAQQSLPAAPERGTDHFIGWLLDGETVTAQTSLPGASTDGAPVELQATASWSPTSLLTGLANDAATVTAGESVTFTPTVVDAEGTELTTDPATWTISGDADATIDPATGEVTVTATTAGTIPLTLTAPVGAGAHSARIDLTVEAGPTTAIELTPSADSVNQGDSVEITATGTDAYGNSTGDVTEDVTLTSHVDTDVVEGNAVTFPHASPHTITGTHVDGASATVLIEVVPAAEPEPSPTAPSPAAPAPAAPPSAHLPNTGADTSLPAGTALTLLLAGAGVLALVRRRRLS